MPKWLTIVVHLAVIAGGAVLSHYYGPAGSAMAAAVNASLPSPFKTNTQ